MLTYNNDPAVKQMYVDRMKADGREWCSIHGYNYAKFGYDYTNFGYDYTNFGREIAPEWVARLGDTLLENSSEQASANIELRILEEIPVGADISHLEIKMKIFILNQSKSIVESVDRPDCEIKTRVLHAINQCIDVQAREPSDEELRSARLAATNARPSKWGVMSLSFAASSAAWTTDRSVRSVSLSAVYASLAAAWATGEVYEAGEAKAAIFDAQAEYLLKILSEI